MSRSRPLVFLGLAIAIALVTSLLIYKKLQGAPIDASEGQGVKVAVAARDIVWGTKLAPDMIKIVKFPKDSIPEGHFESTDAVTGRIILSQAKTSEPILESKLAPSSVSSGGMAAVMNPDKRAMAVKVDEVVGVAGFIKPGDHVDVMVTMSHAGNVEKLFTKLLLENVLVLATGSDIEKKGKDDKPSPVSVITLEVSPEEAEKLALATTEGKLRLALRNPQSAQAVLTTGATVDSLLSSYQLHKATPVQKVVKPAKQNADPVEVRLKEQLNELIPGEEIAVQAVNGHLTLSGSVSSVAAQNQALALAQAFTQGKVINLLQVVAKNHPALPAEDLKIELIKGTSMSNVKFSPQAGQ